MKTPSFQRISIVSPRLAKLAFTRLSTRMSGLGGSPSSGFGVARYARLRNVPIQPVEPLDPVPLFDPVSEGWARTRTAAPVCRASWPSAICTNARAWARSFSFPKGSLGN